MLNSAAHLINQEASEGTLPNSMGSLLGKQLEIRIDSYEQFLQVFPYSGDAIYQLIFELCGSSIKTKKQRFAVANLKSIFEATFKICSQSSFHAMSLRNLCDATGISMGGLYSCIKGKYQLLLLVKELVRFLSDEMHCAALQIESPSERLEWFIRNNIYMTTLLQPWFFFLYVETHSLEGPDQLDSKEIELDTINRVEKILEQGICKGEFNVNDTATVATIFFSMEQEWYMKPWKYRGRGVGVDQYVETLLETSHTLTHSANQPV